MHFHTEAWKPAEAPRRIALIGAALSGRSEILRAAAEKYRVPLHSSVTASEPRSAILHCEGEGWAAASFTGSVWNEEGWTGVLAWADRVLIVLDIQKEREQASRAVLDRAWPQLIAKSFMATQVTKLDLWEREELRTACFDPAEAPAHFGLADYPSFVSTTFLHETLTEGMDYLLERL